MKKFTQFMNDFDSDVFTKKEKIKSKPKSESFYDFTNTRKPKKKRIRNVYPE